MIGMSLLLRPIFDVLVEMFYYIEADGDFDFIDIHRDWVFEVSLTHVET